MSDWIERTNWMCPVPLSAFVEITGRNKQDVKRGAAIDFEWGYDLDGESNIHYYRVLSQFHSKVAELQTKFVEVRLPETSIMLEFPDAQTCNLMMVWWEESGAVLFDDYVKSLQD